MLTLNKIPEKNIKAHPFRSLLLIFLVAVQTLCFFYTVVLAGQMKSELEISEQRFGADIIVYPYSSLTKISKNKLLMQGTPVCYYLSRSVLKKFDNCAHIKEYSFQVYVLDESGAEPIWITGIEADKDFVIRPWLKDNKKLTLKENEVFAGSNVKAENGFVKLFNHDFKVASNLDTTGSPLDSMVYVSMETLKNIIEISKAQGIKDYKKLNPFKSFSAMLINTDGQNYISSVTSWINLHMRKVIAVRSEETMVSSSNGIHSSLNLTIIISAILWLILFAALFIAQSMIMKERKKEFYVWFTVGASSGKISRVLLSESFLLILTGFLAGFSVFAIFLLFKGLLLDFSVTGLALIFFAALLVSIITGILSSYITLKFTVKKLNCQMLVSA